MTRSRQTALLLLFLSLVAAGGALAWWSSREAPIEAGGLDIDRAAPDVSSMPQASQELDALVEREVQSTDDPTTVVWPLEVDLRLIEHGTFEIPQGATPLASGANAEMKGNVYSPQGVGEQATVEFIAGPNAGRVLTCDADGAYGASDLYGGLSIVEIKTPTGRVAQREVLLREFAESPLTIGFGRPASVYGTVVDARNEPLADASVLLDGREMITDENGEFYFPTVASGKALAIVSKPGYATYREVVPLTAGFVVEPGKLSFRLERGASLEVSVQEAIGAREPAWVYVIPSGGQRVNSVRGQRTFPWYSVNPVRVFPGSSTLVEDLPAGRVELVLFHSGAVAKPRSVAATLTAGQTKSQILHLEPAQQLFGTVSSEGVPVARAHVRLEAPHRSKATTKALRKRHDFGREIVMPHVPAALQEVRSDEKGRFVFTTYPDSADIYYLTAETDDGRWRASRAVQLDEADLDIELEQVSSRLSSIEIAMPRRYQGLPVEVRVQGEPRAKYELAAVDPLKVAELEKGTWRLDLRWNGEYVERGATVVVADEPAQLEVRVARRRDRRTERIRTASRGPQLMSASSRRNVRAPELPPHLDQVGARDGKFSLESLRGRFVVLEFWTFC